MIDFLPINIDHRDEIIKIISKNEQETSDFSFANLFAWSDKFLSVFAIIENSFFAKTNCCSDKSCYMFPIGEMDLKKAVPMLLDDAKERNHKFSMIGITQEMWEQINSIFPNKFSYFPDRNLSEYVYLSENLINLKGSKLQSKRNHINNFKKENPSWYYKRINDKNGINECLKMLNSWEVSEKERLSASQYAEYYAVKKMLENYEELFLTVAAIFVDNNIVAFTIGERLNKDTFIVHCEKAYTNIKGTYTIINQQFIENEASNFTYVNREEDLGIEGLRKAKNSYYPIKLIQKGNVELNSI